MNRRGFLAGLGALLAAPAIVHGGNLMPIRAISPSITIEELLRERMNAAYAEMARAMNESLYGSNCGSGGLGELITPVRFPFRQIASGYEIRA